MPAPDRDSAKARRRRLAAGALLLAAAATFRARALSLLESYGAGSIDAHAWAGAYVEVLIDLHTQAAYAGRSVAATLTGDAVPVLGSRDEAYGVARAAEQAREYVQGFRRDLENGRYRDSDGHLDPDLAASRVDLYANGANGTANGMLVGCLPLDAEGYIRWMLEPGAEEAHCDDCPRWAAGGPYTRDTLPAVPGDGRSRCKTNCLCHLEVYGIAVPMLARPGRTRP